MFSLFFFFLLLAEILDISQESGLENKITMKMQTKPVSTRQCCPPPCVFILDKSPVRNRINLQTDMRTRPPIVIYVTLKSKSWGKTEKKVLNKISFVLFLLAQKSIYLSANIVNYYQKSSCNETVTISVTWSLTLPQMLPVNVSLSFHLEWLGDILDRVTDWKRFSTLIKLLTETSMWHHSCADASRADPGVSSTAFQHAAV